MFTIYLDVCITKIWRQFYSVRTKDIVIVHNPVRYFHRPYSFFACFFVAISFAKDVQMRQFSIFNSWSIKFNPNISWIYLVLDSHNIEVWIEQSFIVTTIKNWGLCRMVLFIKSYRTSYTKDRQILGIKKLVIVICTNPLCSIPDGIILIICHQSRFKCRWSRMHIVLIIPDLNGPSVTCGWSKFLTAKNDVKRLVRLNLTTVPYSLTIFIFNNDSVCLLTLSLTMILVSHLPRKARS